MLKSTLFILLSLASIHARSQSDRGLIDWPARAGDTSYIFTDTAFIRPTPNILQSPADTLLPLSTFKGITAPWLHISYTRNGTAREGYCWEGLLTPIPICRANSKFIVGYDRVVDSNANGERQQLYSIKLKTVIGGRKGPSIQWYLWKDQGAISPAGKIMNNLGLDNVRHIVTFSFGLPACGVPDIHYYFALLKDDRLVALPQRLEMSEAGQFYNTSRFIFPAESKGRPGQIILLTEHGEVPEDWPENKAPVYKSTKNRKVFQWDGATGTFTEIAAK